ncbi:DUF3619 family protein [Nitrosomonas oligotropha]|uniref:DUF3619 family protein n=1 Tax=Nitrosomonas oligotropha TaxID=42354 RepID=UPI000D4BEAD5|nr:DUF3619 family protein [Nitrosomonas oligotropha]
MNEQEFGKEISRLLDQGADQTIKQSTLYRLQVARRAALENCQPTMNIIQSGNGTSLYGRHSGHMYAMKVLLLMTVLFILMNIVYYQFWENDKYAAIDTMILADDLPIDAYIANEFDEWLDID